MEDEVKKNQIERNKINWTRQMMKINVNYGCYQVQNGIIITALYKQKKSQEFFNKFCNKPQNQYYQRDGVTYIHVEQNFIKQNEQNIQQQLIPSYILNSCTKISFLLFFEVDDIRDLSFSVIKQTFLHFFQIFPQNQWKQLQDSVCFMIYKANDPIQTYQNQLQSILEVRRGINFIQHACLPNLRNMIHNIIHKKRLLLWKNNLIPEQQNQIHQKLKTIPRIPFKNDYNFNTRDIKIIQQQYNIISKVWQCLAENIISYCQEGFKIEYFNTQSNDIKLSQEAKSILICSQQNLEKIKGYKQQFDLIKICKNQCQPSYISNVALFINKFYELAFQNNLSCIDKFLELLKILYRCKFIQSTSIYIAFWCYKHLKQKYLFLNGNQAQQFIYKNLTNSVESLEKILINNTRQIIAVLSHKDYFEGEKPVNEISSELIRIDQLKNTLLMNQTINVFTDRIKQKLLKFLCQLYLMQVRKQKQPQRKISLLIKCHQQSLKCFLLENKHYLKIYELLGDQLFKKKQIKLALSCYYQVNTLAIIKKIEMIYEQDLEIRKLEISKMDKYMQKQSMLVDYIKFMLKIGRTEKARQLCFRFAQKNQHIFLNQLLRTLQNENYIEQYQKYLISEKSIEDIIHVPLINKIANI